ncbi:MAG: hypothetical protein EPO65_13655 [Dehalococcoidia bacterium]|nr:MAG: hypothetical protein EPO65_13655 [Dehalococcoidia bacterium]
MSRLSLTRWLATATSALVLGVALLAPSRIQAQVAPLPPVSPPFVGAAPKPGDLALLATSRVVTASELSAGLTSAGCTPVVLAVTVNGQWQVFVAASATPTFVNAPFAAAVPMLAAGQGFFVRCQPATPPTGLERASIESIEVVRSDATAPSYWAVISSVVAGCAKFERIDTKRTGDTFEVTVYNRVPQTLAACPAIIGWVTNRVALTGDLVLGRTYTVAVNDRTTTFVAGSTSINIGGPAAPTYVRLTGAIPDLLMSVPVGEAERGRVTVLWDSTAASVTGFRIYERDCSGVPTGIPFVVPAADRQYGPLQPCRPGGNVGVAALSAAGESPIVWAR